MLDLGPQPLDLAAQISPRFLRRDELDVVHERRVEVLQSPEDSVIERMALTRKHASPVQPLFGGSSELDLLVASDAPIGTSRTRSALRTMRILFVRYLAARKLRRHYLVELVVVLDQNRLFSQWRRLLFFWLR